jgi:biotin-(acetyl-CoA carboxylase) ligase
MLQNINQKLAYRDQEVRLVGEREVVRGIVQYVREDGRLRITTESGEISVGSGGMHLIPLDLWDENK